MPAAERLSAAADMVILPSVPVDDSISSRHRSSMRSTQAVREKYEAMAPQFDRLEAPAEWLGLRSLRRGLFGRARGAVLEVAIGTGRNIPLYNERVERLTGIDLSPAMLEVARERAGRARFAVDLLEGAAESLPFQAATFDTVTSSLSTCTFADPVRALREMARVARPGGAILLLEHGRSGSRWLARFQDWRAEAHAKTLGCRWNQEPLEHVRDAGLRLVRARRVFFGVFHVMEIAAGEP